MQSNDPLRNGSIFRLETNSLDKLRQQRIVVMKPPTEIPEQISEIIPGVKAKFENMYRATPNQMMALMPHTTKSSSSTPLAVIMSDLQQPPALHSSNIEQNNTLSTYSEGKIKDSRNARRPAWNRYN